jgi:Fe-S cluster biogenesis protein NfuA
MISREQIDVVLDRIRPLLRSDGGDIELVDVIGNTARVRLTGRCAGCPSAYMTLHVGVERALRKEVADFEQLIAL